MDDFGQQGERPSHPELLDYLAARFVAADWSFKQMIREIVSSRAYQLSSEHNDEAFRADPENRLLWRMNRRRLDVEALRDSLLAISGQLDASPAESVVAALPDQATGVGDKPRKPFASVRRSVYCRSYETIFGPNFRSLTCRSSDRRDAGTRRWWRAIALLMNSHCCAILAYPRKNCSSTPVLRTKSDRGCGLPEYSWAISIADETIFDQVSRAFSRDASVDLRPNIEDHLMATLCQALMCSFSLYVD